MANTDIHQALNECIIERDALAESHAELIAALFQTSRRLHGRTAANHRPPLRFCGKLICIRARAALTKAQALVAK